MIYYIYHIKFNIKLSAKYVFLFTKNVGFIFRAWVWKIEFCVVTNQASFLCVACPRIFYCAEIHMNGGDIMRLKIP